MVYELYFSKYDTHTHKGMYSIEWRHRQNNDVCLVDHRVSWKEKCLKCLTLEKERTWHREQKHANTGKVGAAQLKMAKAHLYIMGFQEIRLKMQEGMYLDLNSKRAGHHWKSLSNKGKEVMESYLHLKQSNSMEEYGQQMNYYNYRQKGLGGQLVP